MKIRQLKYSRTSIYKFALMFKALLCLFVITSAGEGSQSHSVLINESAILSCNTSGILKFNKQWRFGESILFYNKLCADTWCSKTISLLDSYSLLISPVSIHHEGIYQCMQESQTIARHLLRVQGLFLSILL